MTTRILLTLSMIALWQAVDGGVMPTALATDEAPPAMSPPPAVNAGQVDDLLKLDIDQLSQVRVGGASQETSLSAPSNRLDATADLGEATSTGELLTQSPSVTARRTSALDLDPRVRGYHSGQLNATANGIPELKTRVDIDSVFSQIDPGVVDNVTIIDGPYTSLYGPGFAFLAADLLPVPRYGTPQAHLGSTFMYNSNGGGLYNRDTVTGGGKDWGMCLSYGVRQSNDYFTGGDNPYRIPSSYQKWDDLAELSFDLNKCSRIEVNCLRTEMNGVELPGVVYDINNSRNDQFSIRYIIQEDPKGPQQFVLQTWWNQTFYCGDSSSWSKQQSLYNSYITQPTIDATDPSLALVNTFGYGSLESTGVRALRTFGDAGTTQWTVGADWHRTKLWYAEYDYQVNGQLAYGGNVYGIPHSTMDDIGLLTDVKVPLSDRCSVEIGGRLDQCKAAVDSGDPVITQISDPTQYYYIPGINEPSTTLGMAYLSGRYKLSDGWTVKAGTGYATRMPEPYELYTDEPFAPTARFGNSYTDGNSFLRPERDLQFDLGLNYQSKRASCGIRGFYSIIRDFIMPVSSEINPTSPLPQPKVLGRNFQDFPPSGRTDLGTINENADTNQAGYQYLNIDQATLCGGDLFAEVKVSEVFSVFGNMSYVLGTNDSPVAFEQSSSGQFLDGRIIPLGGTEGLPGMYPFNGVVGVRFREPSEDRWFVEFGSRMVHRQTFVATSLSEIPTAGFTVFNLRGYYRVNKNLRLTADFENLLNRSYYEPGSLAIVGPNGVPAFVQDPGFSAILGLDARF
jgi:iron complex outermembrane recepter protein